MKEFKVLKSGTRADGSHWIYLEKEIEGSLAVLKCFMKTSALVEVDGTISLPAKLIPWTL